MIAGKGKIVFPCVLIVTIVCNSATPWLDVFDDESPRKRVEGTRLTQ